LIYFIANTSTLGIDGGLYCSFARTIVTEGRFYAKIIDTAEAMPTPYYHFKGFTPYPLTIFSIAFFMLIGDASYASAKVMTLFAGLLSVSLIYLFSKELFGLKAAVVAGLLAAVNPMLSYYSTILHGPEIISSLFSLGALYIFIKALRRNTADLTNRLKYAFLSGLFIGFTYESHQYTEFIVLLPALILRSLIYRRNEGNELQNVLAIPFPFILLFLIVKYRGLPVVSLPITLILISFTIIMIQRKKDYYNLVAVTSLIAALTIWFFGIRFYIIPELVQLSMAELKERPTQVLNPFSAYHGININLEYIRETFNRIWYSLQYLSSFIVFLFAFASFMLPTNRKGKLCLALIPIIASIIYTLYFPPFVSWYKGYLDIFPDRLLIFPVSSIIILSSSIFEDIMNISKKYIRKREASSVAILTLIIIMLFLPAVLGLPIGASHIEYLNELTYYDPLRTLNWKRAIEWMSENTPRNATILVAEPRRLAWFTDRITVRMPDDPEGITMEKLASLIKTFNVDYVFIDNFLATYRVISPDVKYLYNEELNEGETVSLSKDIEQLVEEIVETGNKSYILNTLGLKLVFSDYDPETSKITRIYKVVSIKLKFRILFVDTFDNIENSIKLWIPMRKCNLTIRDSNAILTIPTEKPDWVYIRSNTTIILNATKNVYFAYKVKGLTSTANYYTALVDADDKWYKYPSDTKAPLDFTVNGFEVNMNKPIKYILLGVSGEGYPAVVYDYVLLFDYDIVENDSDG